MSKNLTVFGLVQVIMNSLAIAFFHYLRIDCTLQWALLGIGFACITSAIALKAGSR